MDDRSSSQDELKRDPSLTLVPVVETRVAKPAPKAEGDALMSKNGDLFHLFSLRRPKHFTAGLSSGLKTLGKGVALGVASVLSAPIIGAKQEGIIGLGKGVVTGVTLGVTLPITAAGVAVVQVGRGVVNTPSGVTNTVRGMKWDKKKREWMVRYYSLPDEIVEVSRLVEELEAHTEDSVQPRNVADTTLYDTLGVPPTATGTDIRRAYYKLAKDNHPDKNPGDSEAGARFQKIGAAYQILGDDVRRRDYDTNGLSATQEVELVDNDLFFMMLFGSESLEPYIGQLQLGTMFSNNGVDDEETALLQRKREVELAALLVSRIDGFVTASSDEQEKIWIANIRKDIVTLCEKSFGEPIVDAVGWGYQNYADQYLGKMSVFGYKKTMAQFQAQKRSFEGVLTLFGSAVKTVVATRSYHEVDPNEAPTPEQVRAMQESLPQVIDTMLRVCLMDIAKTVRQASKKSLKDGSVSLQIRIRRGQAVHTLGLVMQECASEVRKKGNTVNVRHLMEEAQLKAMMKKQQDEHDE